MGFTSLSCMASVKKDTKVIKTEPAVIMIPGMRTTKPKSLKKLRRKVLSEVMKC